MIEIGCNEELFVCFQMDAKFVRNQRFARRGNVGVVEARKRHEAKKIERASKPKSIKL